MPRRWWMIAISLFNRRDDCCFGLAQHSGPAPYEESLRAYEQQLQAQLQRLGSGAFRLEIDETAPSHFISHHAATNLILREIKSSQPNRPLTLAPQ